jgi:hypothetical protein
MAKRVGAAVAKLRMMSGATLLVALLVGCGQQWSQSEKDNAQHFVRSLDLVIEAHKISNATGAGPMPTEKFAVMVDLYEHALSEAKLVTDEVLAKAAPELPKNYRLYFQKGIDLRISGWTNRRPSDEIQGSGLMDTWADWYKLNR